MAVYDSRRAAYPAFAKAAIARSTGGGSDTERTLAAPIHFLGLKPLFAVQCVCDTTNTRTAMHPFNPKRKFCQFPPRLIFDDTPDEETQRHAHPYSQLLLDEQIVDENCLRIRHISGWEKH